MKGKKEIDVNIN